MRTWAITESTNEIPKKENVSDPAVAGTTNIPSEFKDLSNNGIEVVSAESTSLKMAPKPLVKAGVLVPGKKKLTSMTLLPSEVKRRCGLNGSNVWEYVGSILSNWMGAIPAFALT